MRTSLTPAAAALALLGAALLTLPGAQARPSGRPAGSCLRISQIQGTRMAGMRALYIRAGDGALWRMDFGADCNDVGDEPLVLHPVDNGDLICSAVELNVSVRHTGELCDPVSLRRLDPSQTAGIPRKDLP